MSNQTCREPEYDDTACHVCGAALPDQPAPYSPADYGFCSPACCRVSDERKISMSESNQTNVGQGGPLHGPFDTLREKIEILRTMIGLAHDVAALIKELEDAGLLQDNPQLARVKGKMNRVQSLPEYKAYQPDT